MLSIAKLTLVFLGLNILLFSAKLSAGLWFGSLAVLSDAFNSLIDIASSVMIFYAVKIGSKPADSDHNFGHARAEPLAAFTVSILIFVLAFEVIREAIARIISGAEPKQGLLPILVLIFVVVVKGGMYFLARSFGKRKNSPALVAVAVDSKMDVVISILALGGVVGANLGYPMFDVYAALLISVWIVWAGFNLARENINKLLGSRPDKDTLGKIKLRLSNLVDQKKIVEFHDLRVQFIGSEIQVCVHVRLPKDSSFKKVHDSDKYVQKELKKVKGVSEVAVHVDPA